MEHIKNLTLTNDLIFCNVFENNEDLCKELLEIILEQPIRKIVYLNKQEELDEAYDAKGVRMDVYLKDEEDTIYDIEMQSTPISNLPKRSRYYQSIIDMHRLEKSADYEMLKKTFIIFICMQNPFDGLHCKYTFQNMCIENPSLFLKDETTKIVITPKGNLDDTSPNLKAFLDYISQKGPTDDFTKKLDTAVTRARQSKEVINEIMARNLFEHDAELRGFEQGEKKGYEQGEKKGFEQGEKSAYVIALKNLIANTNMPMEEAVHTLGIPEEEREKYIALVNNSN